MHQIPYTKSQIRKKDIRKKTTRKCSGPLVQNEYSSVTSSLWKCCLYAIQAGPCSHEGTIICYYWIFQISRQIKRGKWKLGKTSLIFHWQRIQKMTDKTKTKRAGKIGVETSRDTVLASNKFWATTCRHIHNRHPRQLQHTYPRPSLSHSHLAGRTSSAHELDHTPLHSRHHFPGCSVKTTKTLIAGASPRIAMPSRHHMTPNWWSGWPEKSTVESTRRREKKTRECDLRGYFSSWNILHEVSNEAHFWRGVFRIIYSLSHCVIKRFCHPLIPEFAMQRGLVHMWQIALTWSAEFQVNDQIRGNHWQYMQTGSATQVVT